MADGSESGFLKAIELRLLRCTLLPHPASSPPTQPSNSLRPLVEDLVCAIERGDYAAALSSDAVRLVFGFADSWDFADSAESASAFYSQVERSVESFLDIDADADSDCRFALVISIAVAALLAFTQQNVTGPCGDFSPFPLFIPHVKATTDAGKEWDMWARSQIESVGSHLLGKLSLLQYIIYAIIMLTKAKYLSNEGRNSGISGNKSITWWLCRLILLQQRILDGLSSYLYETLQVLKNETLLQFGKLENVTGYWSSSLYEGEASVIVSAIQIEAGIIEYKYGRVDSSRLHLRSAEEACGLHLSVTGVLGFRTMHQVDAKSQMVLVTNMDQRLHGGGKSAEFSQAQHNSSACEETNDSHPHGHYEGCDILMTPKLVENGSSGVPNEIINVIDKDMMLTATQQAVILAHCLPLSRSQREDELLNWGLAPFIEAVDAQLQSIYVIRSFSDILRIRWESTRSRTKQRAFVMMDKLVGSISEAFPVAAKRIQFSFGVYIPTIPALRKEYGELSVSCGMIQEALKIFEDLELWDNLIYCYRLLDKKAAAVDLINARLCDNPTDARLWCSLGDVTNNDAYYKKALEVSNDKSARAQRSLARNAYNRGDYLTSRALWESAIALNSLYPDAWFALGSAALKERDTDRALDAFTNAVQLDPENGEAWNNLASLHMLKKKSKPAFIAFREALKFRRNSWQLWENYSYVAFDIGNFQQALEATKMVLDLSKNKRVNVELLDKLMRKVEGSTCKPVPSSFNADEDHNNCRCETDSSHLSTIVPDESRQTELMMVMLGNILKQVIQSGGGKDIWGIYARWHKMRGDLLMCSQALVHQVQSYQGSDMWHDRDRFKKFAHASLLLCKVYIEIASSNDGQKKELKMAEMHLRNSVKQGVNFSDTEEFRDLQSCLDEVQKKLDATSS